MLKLLEYLAYVILPCGSFCLPYLSAATVPIL